jgi:hypothetical protein
MEQRVQQALQGDAAAVSWLEARLPAAHSAIRMALERRPDAPQASALRLLLTLFDE